MVLNVFSIASFAFVSGLSGAQSDTRAVTISSVFAPQYVGGKHTGCQITFEVLRQDFEFSNGEWRYLTGSLGFDVHGGTQPVVRLKLGVSPVKAPPEFVRPAEAFIVSGYKTNVDDRLINIEGEEGFRIFAFTPNDTTFDLAVAELSKDNKFSFLYSMRNGGLGAVVPVDAAMRELNLGDPVNSRQDTNVGKNWLDCISRVLGSLDQP